MMIRMKSVILSVCIILSGIIVPVSSVMSEENPAKVERRERCVQILHTALKGDSGFWVSVHAAENLLFNVYTEGIEEHFRKLNSSEDSNIIGIITMTNVSATKRLLSIVPEKTFPIEPLAVNSTIFAIK